MTRTPLSERIASGATALAAFIAVLLLVAIVVALVHGGAPALSWAFVTGGTSSDPARSGLGPVIWGTALLTVLMTVAVVPVGVGAALYLTEIASPRSRLTRLARSLTESLAGVPSVVFGLFGLGFFILFLGHGIDSLAGETTPLWGRPCVLWSAMTLAVLTLPTVVVATEEALRAVPRDLRDAALALGATRMQTIRHIVLPRSLPGILTAVILAVSRGAGEVAPLLFTGAASYVPYAPLDLRDRYMHLGHHVYVLATQSPDAHRAVPAAYATALVLLVLTVALNVVAVLLRRSARAA